MGLFGSKKKDKQRTSDLDDKYESFHSLEQYEEAIACCDEAIALDPKHYLAWLHKGNSLNQLGKYEEAIACYDKVIQFEDPLHSESALFDKGVTLFRLERYEESLTCFDDAIRLHNPGTITSIDRYTVLHSKGMVLFMLKRYEESIACYDEVNKAVPEFLEAWNQKGYNLKELGRHEEAEQCFAKAKELDES
jgi:tetratricopeptide (TPR) repeat protein